jgi:hypothetical protein
MNSTRPFHLYPAEAQCLFVDVQRGMLDAIPRSGDLLSDLVDLHALANELEIPCGFSVHRTDVFGGLSEQFQLPERYPEFRKSAFSVAHHPEFQAWTGAVDSVYTVVVGVESHICVMQTVIDLRAQGRIVVVVEDAIRSADRNDHHVAVERMRSAGAIVTTIESLVFEWAADGHDPAFKFALPWIKQRRQRLQDPV